MMRFEWDEAKRAANLEKHGVDFLDAAKIFAAPVVEAIDGREDYGEVRVIALGRSPDGYFVVAHTWRGEARRIISAWKAGSDDRERYDAAVSG